MFREKSSSETQINCQKSCEKCGERSNALNMPTSDISLDPSNITGTKLLMKITRIRRLYVRPLNMTNLKNMPLKRGDNFRKSRKVKRVKSGEQTKFTKNQWVTSGPLGSRDAVLVFRTNVLNTKDDELQTTLSSLSTLSGSTSSLNVGAKDAEHSNVISSKPKVLLSLPKNSKSNTSSKKIYSRTLEPITSPKKRLHESLSSSDNSLCSECEEDEVTEGTKGGNGRLLKKDGKSQPGEKDTTSLDDKENIDEGADLAVAEMPASSLKITFKFMNTETRLLRKIFLRHGLTEVEGDQNFSILWTGIHMKPDILRNLTPYQRVNHFPRSYELTRKDRLYKNIEKMQHLRGFKHFDIVPQSFILPLEYRDLVTAHNKYRGPWIVKPAASSRGRGIFIVNSPDQVPVEEQLLVSKYISDPLCIDGHKCDLRVYVLVTSFDPLLLYVYEEGLVRIATVKYERNVENLWNPCMHLCNYSINKYHSDYIRSRDADDEDVGHKWTLSALLRHLKSQGCDTRQLMANIEELIIKSMMACAQSIISACRMFVPNGSNCFELYGFDILIDDTLKPWLLEINLSPSLGIDTPLDTKVKASLMTDLLTLVGIPAYSPVQRNHYDSKWSRFKSVTCTRRTNSADPIGGSSFKKSGHVNVQVNLTPEESRIVRAAKLQNSRRGGFVRIFPTEDSIQRYGTFLDPATGIPVSTSISNGQTQPYAMILSHNFNLMLHQQLYNGNSKANQNNSFDDRMNQYERALEKAAVINLGFKKLAPKCVEQGKRLRRQIRKLIENGHELTQLQARQIFSNYLECVLKRLLDEPRTPHEKLVLKFVNRVSGSFRAPMFLRTSSSYQVLGKDRSAMVAKLLGDYLETYSRETEAFVDSFDNFSMIPSTLFSEFLLHAQEADYESVLTLHTNITQTLPFLYNRCAAPITPPIPTGAYGFLKALPSMVPGGHTRDQYKIDSFYKALETKEAAVPSKTASDKVEVKKAPKPADQSTSKLTVPKKKLQLSKR